MFDVLNFGEPSLYPILGDTIVKKVLPIAFSLVCVLSVVSSTSFAQNKKAAESKTAESKMAASTPLLQTMQTMETLSFHPNDVEYPKNLSSTGVQGRVLVSAIMQADGSLKNPMILDSSRSLALDLAAINVVKNVQYQLAKPLQSKDGIAVQVPLEFLKDTYATINQKSCAEFSQDFAYLKQTFADQKMDELEVFKIPLGSIFLFLNETQKAKYPKKSALIRETTMLECAKNPAQKLMPLMKEITQRALNAA
jgi:TonB family protein